MNAEIEEYFYLLREVCRADDSSLGTAYRQLRELLEHLCRTQMTDSSLQMTDLAARINFVSSKLGLTVAEQNRLHTFRLASNAVLNRQAEPSREKLLRDAKTVSFFVKRITGEDIPADLYRFFPQADATYIAAPRQRNVYGVCASIFSMPIRIICMYCLWIAWRTNRCGYVIMCLKSMMNLLRLVVYCGGMPRLICWMWQ